MASLLAACSFFNMAGECLGPSVSVMARPSFALSLLVHQRNLPYICKNGLCGCQCGDKNLVFSLQMNHSRRRHTSIRRPKKKKPKTNKVSFDIWIILFPPFLSYNRLYTSFSTKFFNGHDARYVTDATPRRGAAFHNSLLFLI